MTFRENIGYNTIAAGILSILLKMLPGAVTCRDGTGWDVWQFNKYLEGFGFVLFSEAYRALVQ